MATIALNKKKLIVHVASGAYKKSNYCLGNTEKRERGQGAGPITLGRQDQNQENVIQSDQPDHCHVH